jgi:hypothetical protein
MVLRKVLLSTVWRELEMVAGRALLWLPGVGVFLAAASLQNVSYGQQR